MALCSHWWTETRSVDDKNWNTTSSSINLIDCGLFLIFYLAFVDRCFKSRCSVANNEFFFLVKVWFKTKPLALDMTDTRRAYSRDILLFRTWIECCTFIVTKPSPLHPCNYLCGSLNYEDLLLCSHLNVHYFSHSSLDWLTFLFTTFSASDQDKKTRKTTMKLLFWGC